RAEYRLVGADGVVRWVLHSQRPEQTLDGLLVYGSIEDVTVQRTVADRLRSSQARLRRMGERLAARAGYGEGGGLGRNARAAEIAGLDRDEQWTADAWFAKLGPDAEGMRPGGGHAAESAAESRTLVLRRPDGEASVVEFSGYAFEDGEVWLLNDVTA